MPTSDATKKPAARSGSAKPASAKPAARRSAAKAAAAKPVRPAATAEDGTTPNAATSAAAVSGALRLKGLIERVAATTGGKKKAVKDIVEATLAELSKALEAGEPINLPGLGRIRVKAAKEGSTPAAMTLKRRAGARGEGKKKVEKEPLAEGGEAG